MTIQSDIFVGQEVTSLTFNLPIPPRPWARTGGQGKRRFTPEHLREYYKTIAYYATTQLQPGWREFTEPCTLTIYLNPEYAQIHVTRDLRLRRLLRGDLSNYVKSIEDGLQGVLWQNDRQIARLIVEEVDVPLEDFKPSESEAD